METTKTEMEKAAEKYANQFVVEAQATAKADFLWGADWQAEQNDNQSIAFAEWILINDVDLSDGVFWLNYEPYTAAELLTQFLNRLRK